VLENEKNGIKDWFYSGYFDAVTCIEEHITGLGIVVVNPYQQVVHVDSIALPEVGDTQESEYMALLWLLKHTANRGVPMIKAMGDNDSVTKSIEQLTPSKKRKYKFYQRAIWKELERFRWWKVHWLASESNPADDLSRALIRGWSSKPPGERQIELINRIAQAGNGSAFGVGISQYTENVRGKKFDLYYSVEPTNHGGGLAPKPDGKVFDTRVA
jgi:ribonuclease HI